MERGVNSREYFGKLFQENFPVSFRYDGSAFDFNAPSCIKTVESRDADSYLMDSYTFQNEDGLTIVADVKYYKEYPAVDWVLVFRNDSAENTKILSEIKSVDMLWRPNEELISYPEFPLLRYSRGSEGRMDDFSFTEEYLNVGQSKEFGAGNGVSSDYCLPFFNLKYGKQGLITAIGWSGNWFCRFDHFHVPVRNSVKITAGIDKTYFYLKPGEEIRMPSVLQLYWLCDIMESHNLLRRLLVKEYSPVRKPGEELRLPVSSGSWGGLKTPGHLENIRFGRDRKLPFTCYWMDAGWFGHPHDAEEFQNLSTEDWYGCVGDWRVNSVMHPHGLKPISDAAHENGMDFLLWVEPERAVNKTPVTLEHPDWFFRLPDSIPRICVGSHGPVDSLFLNYGNPDALKWVTDFICDLIKTQGVDIYRQDMNTNPMPYWDAYEEPDRVGMLQIKHINGLYRFLDELLLRNPGLLIDNCAGGGKRLDIEMMKRSVALHRSDYTVHFEPNPIGGQSQSHGIMHWVPYSGMGSLPEEGDTYQFRSEMNACLSLSVRRCGGRDLTPDQLQVGIDGRPWDWTRKMMEEHRRIAHMFSGDFYPLLKFSLSEKVWYAYQLDREDLFTGMALAFRRKECENATEILKLHGLSGDHKYSLENVDTGEVTVHTGKELTEQGLTVEIRGKRQSALFIYTRIDMQPYYLCSKAAGCMGV